MRKLLSAIVVASFVVASAAQAVVSCPERSPAGVFAVAADSLKCQDAIAKEGAKYIAAKLKALSKCKLKAPTGTCPDTKTTEKIDKARNKTVAKITKACGADAAQAGLSSSYASLTDDTVLSSCMLSQHSVSAELLSAISNGATTESWPTAGKDRDGCVKEISKSAAKFFGKAHKNATKCLAAQAKAGTAGDLAPVCVGSFDNSETFVAPTDAKAAADQAKLLLKIEGKIAKKCGDAATLDEIKTIFACEGAETVADVQQCVACAGWDAVFDAIEQQYSESGVFVAHGPGALQLAVGTGTAQAAALAGTKFLIEPGTYEEEVTIFQGGDNIAMVGCGAASDDRPRIVPPAPQVTGRGILSNDVDGLLFQSLDFFDQDNDHIRVTNAQGVTFRDITGDGNQNTAYAVFPILSNGVVVELCKVRAQDDAPIYVGQSSGILVRYNDVRDGVAGIEIENSGSAHVYGNYGTNNTAGLLVFKDGDLPIQLSECHEVNHNLFEGNNHVNFGSGTVGLVPEGLGILVISADSTPYHHNITRNNNTGGLVLTDQTTADFDISPPPLANRRTDDNWIFHNWSTGNGGSPDPARWPLAAGYDLAYLPDLADGGVGNCHLDNIFGTELGLGFFNVFGNLGTCTLPVPAFPGCPAPPV
jgi:parallel beta-helix repeat protein